MFPNPFVLFVPFCSKADFLPPSFCLKSDFSFPLSTFCFACCVFPQIPLPDDVEQACIEQVAFWYSRRTQLGLLSISSDAGVVQQFQSTDLLPQVRATLKRYERWVN